MLTDTELDQLARAVAALGDEDAGRLDEAVRELRHRRRAEAEMARIAALRAMSDFDAFEASITSWVSLTGDLRPGEILVQTAPLHFPSRPAAPVPEYLHPDYVPRERARLIAEAEQHGLGDQVREMLMGVGESHVA